MAREGEKSPRGVATIIIVCAVAFGLAGGVILFLFAVYRQPSGSMYPTVDTSARLIVSRLDKTPARGAVMVFRYPEHPDQLFDKRIIGLPGDVVTTSGNDVLVNGWPIPRCILGPHVWAPENTAEPEPKHAGTLVVEFLGEATYLIFLDDAYTSAGPGGPWRTKPSEYFVLGDNRNNSHDSRFWFGGSGGGVPLTNTIGRVRGLDQPVLPKGAEALRPALDACLAKRPAATPPPAAP